MVGPRRRVAFLVAAMTVVCLISGGIAIYVPYTAAFEREGLRLAEILENQVKFVEAVAHFSLEHGGGEPGDRGEAAIAQVMDAHAGSIGFGQTGELVLARRAGDEMIFMTGRHRGGSGSGGSAPFAGTNAEPMRRALRGERGKMVALDYRGEPVLAVYRPVGELGLGAVAKVDLAEIRRPYVSGVAIAGLCAGVAITVCALLFLRVTNPLVDRAEESAARYRAIVDTAVEGIVTIDERGIIESANRAAEEIFGYTSRELIGRNVNILMPSPYRERHDEYLDRYRRTGEARIIGIGREVMGVRKSGELFPLGVAVSEVRLQQRTLFTGILRDLSERQRAEEALREARRVAEERSRLADIGAVAAQVVHDLGNPLAALAMQGRLIQRRMERGDSSQAVRALIANVVSNIGRLQAMTRELRGFAQGIRLELADIAVESFLRSVVELWQPLARDRGIWLGLALTPGGRAATVRGDSAQLQRVFDNLIKNAIEGVGGGGGRIVVSQRWVEAERACFSVEDDGPGVSEKVKLFGLFESTKREGTGLGLAIAKQIVLAHGGTIWHEAASPHGAIFFIELPTQGPAVDVVAS